MSLDLIGPICKVRIGDDEFETGDRLLRFCSVTLGEDARASKCRFEVFDPGLLLADKYFAISISQGGIQVPDDLLGEDKQKEGNINLNNAPAASVADVSQSPEVKAWLDTIAFAEGTAGPNGYNTQFTGTTFQGYSSHPKQLRCSGSICSDAAGRYQFLSTTWDSLGLGAFTPENQDKGAVTLLQRRGALSSAQQGVAGFDDVCNKISYEWASIPPYRYAGQGQYTKAQLLEVYKKNLAKYKGQTPAQNAAAQQAPVKDKADTKPTEVAAKGTEIIIEIGYKKDSLIAYHFIHVGTSTQGRQLDSTVFEGQSIRWLMTRRTKNTGYGNITLKQLADKVAKSYGLTLEMEGEGPTYQFVDQTGITDYELLLREARNIGYTVQDKGAKLILKPYRPEFTGFVITPDILINMQFSDRASKDRQGTSATKPETPAAENKFSIDRLTGVAKQVRLEDTTAVGKAAVNQVKASLNNPKFGEFTKLDLGSLTGSNSVASNNTNQQTTTNAGAATSTAAKPVATTGSPAKPVAGTPAPDSAQKTTAGATTEDPTTGLPKQEIGAIDLQDGKAEAQEIKDEKSRVKGYPGSIRVKTTPEVLQLAPGQIIGISDKCAPGTEVFPTEWRLASVEHTLKQGGGIESTLEIYKPQAKKAGSGSGEGTIDITGGSTSTNDAVASAKGFAEPMKLAGNSSCGPICEFGYARGRQHSGCDYGGYGAGTDPDGVFASHDGVVAFADWAGGYGRLVEIKRSDGWFTRYAHLAKFDVKVGQQVKQGQRVGTRGGSGASGDGSLAIHLHFEIRRPDGQAVNPRSYLPKPGLAIVG